MDNVVKCSHPKCNDGHGVDDMEMGIMPSAGIAIPCRIGLDKATGRVKWCPDCQSIKYLLVLPVILLPVIVVFILMMQISSTFTGRIEIQPTTERIKIPMDSEPYHRLTRDIYSIAKRDCDVVFHHMTDESMKMHENQLFRDVRTSFIPYGICMPHFRNGSDDIDSHLNEKTNNVDDDNQISNSKNEQFPNESNQLQKISNIAFDSLNFYRQRRSASDPAMEYSNDELLERTNKTINNNNLEQIGIDATNEEKPVEIPTVLKTFWKSGKTPDQVRHSQVEIIKQYMDTSVEPCDDFYQYACGNWDKLNPIPKDKAAYDTFEMLREILDIELNHLLAEDKSASLCDGNGLNDCSNENMKNSSSMENNPNARIENENIPSKISAEQKAVYLYESCMNSDLLGKRGLEPLHDLLKSLGGWPVLDPNWNASAFNWLELAAKLRLYNNDVFLMQWVGPDIKNSQDNIIQFDQTSLGLPTRDYFIHASNLMYLEAYQKFAEQVMFLCGASSDESATTAEQIVKFEIELALIMASPEDRLNVSQLYRRMTVKSLYEQVPDIDWQRYLEVVLQVNIDRNETIVMFALSFMKDLVQLLNNTEPKIIANYMFWKFVRHRINSLDDRFHHAKQQFYNVLIGRERSPPRWKNCVNQVNSNMGMAVGAIFIRSRKYFDENSKQDTLAMTHELQESFREILNETSWLDEETRNLAELKVNRMSLKIGYPDYILNENELNEKYADLDIHPNKYFENILNVLLHLTRTEQNKLREKVNRTVWNTAPCVVNAYYSRNKNQIMFPAGILQPPFYHRYLPRSFNFAGIGTVIGHELTHGFDDKGRLFDQDGNLNRWWSETAIENFHQRASCLIAQYGNYKINEIGGLAVDGSITAGENIADNGGIKQAYRAYEKWLRNHCQTDECIEQEHLPGLNVTNKQLFFLNFAQVWCGAMRPEATKSKMKTAVHSPGRFRVIGE